jgi:uncharacterized protein YegP (UPF0339 family)
MRIVVLRNLDWPTPQPRGQWHVRIVGRNNKIVAFTENYASRKNAIRAARRLRAETGLVIHVQD